MSTTRIRYQVPADVLSEGGWVVTAGQRLAREITLSFADGMTTSRSVWLRPVVSPWQQWLQRLWSVLAWRNRSLASRRLLSAGQRRLIWERIIVESRPAELLQPAGAAVQALETWDLACAWQISWSEVAGQASEDATRFLEWARTYRQQCEDNQFLDPGQLADVLADALGAGHRLGLPRRLLLAGFDELTPQQARLAEAMTSAGIQVSQWMPGNRQASVRKQAFDDRESQYIAAARWCRNALAADPAIEIGIVVPGLEKDRDLVERIFEDVLSPGRAEESGPSHSPGFSVSAGMSLASYPMIGHGLMFLELARGEHHWSRWSALLRSPFLGDCLREADARAMLDLKLRESGIVSQDMSTLLLRAQEADEAAIWACPQLCRRLENALAVSAGWPARQDAHGWVSAMGDWLDALGWPGERSLDSAEYQLQQRWRQLLEESAACEEQLGQTDLAGFSAVLQRFSRHTRFKPESSRAPVQVLGVLEAAGMEFDRLWVCGLDDRIWPPAPAPTPFLPATLQREKGLPRGSAARELSFARIQTRRLMLAAEEVVFSWPASEGDSELRASPLIESLAGGDPQLALDEWDGNRAAAIFDQRPQMETLAEVSAPAFTGTRVRGGSRVLDRQSLCPFRAVAEARLQALPMERPEPGFSAAARGRLIHRALERLWRHLQSSASLKQLDAASREALVEECLRAALPALEPLSGTLARHLAEVELSRQKGLILRLLQEELTRDDFTVASCEQEFAVRAGPLQLRLRIDRVDRLADGSQLIIDYKTGMARVGDWFGPRPRVVQLPVYAAFARTDALRGVAVASLRAARTGFVGVCESAQGLPAGIAPPKARQLARHGVSGWPELLVDWRACVTALAEAFKRGDSRVDPLPGACRTCHLQTLCRIDEQSLVNTERDDD